MRCRYDRNRSQMSQQASGGQKRLRDPATVEIAESSLLEDRKLLLMGPRASPVYWIVNLRARQVEVYTWMVGGYGKPFTFKADKSVPVMIDGVNVGQRRRRHPAATCESGRPAAIWRE